MPKAPARFALRIALPLIIVFGHQPHELLAQEQPARFTLRLNGGVAVMPLQEWATFSGQDTNSRYDHPTPDFIGGASIGFRLAPGHSLSFEVEYLTSTAKLTNVGILTTAEGVALGVLDVIQINWAFTGVPVTLYYERHFAVKAAGWSPYIGVGLSYYLTDVQVSVDYLYDPQDFSSLFENTNTELRKSTGYGLALAAGVDIPIGGSLYLSNQLRYRWADGTASEPPGGSAVSFTGYDLSIGFAWHI